MKRQNKSGKNRAKNEDYFSIVSDEVFELCSNRLNKRIKFIEKISGDKIKQTEIAQSEYSWISLDVGAVNRILNNSHVAGRNKFLFPVVGAKDYYLAFEKNLEFEGAYEILWGTVTEILDYLPKIFELLCKAEYELEKNLLQDDQNNDKLSHTKTLIEQRLENFFGNNLEEKSANAFKAVRVPFFKEWLLFTTNQTEASFIVVGEPGEEFKVSSIRKGTKIDDSVDDGYRGFSGINEALYLFSKSTLLKIIN